MMNPSKTVCVGWRPPDSRHTHIYIYVKLFLCVYLYQTLCVGGQPPNSRHTYLYVYVGKRSSCVVYNYMNLWCGRATAK